MTQPGGEFYSSEVWILRDMDTLSSDQRARLERHLGAYGLRWSVLGGMPSAAETEPEPVWLEQADLEEFAVERGYSPKLAENVWSDFTKRFLWDLATTPGREIDDIESIVRFRDVFVAHTGESIYRGEVRRHLLQVRRSFDEPGAVGRWETRRLRPVGLDLRHLRRNLMHVPELPNMNLQRYRLVMEVMRHYLPGEATAVAGSDTIPPASR